MALWVAIFDAPEPDDPKKLEAYLKKRRYLPLFLQSVITDVLDMSKIESGQLELYPKEMDLRLLIEEVHILLENHVENKRLQFHVDCGEMKEPLVQGGRAEGEADSHEPVG